MSQEIWNYVIPVLAGAASVVLDRSISLIVRTAAQKKRDRIKVESEELDMSEKEIRVERERADHAWKRADTLEAKYDRLIVDIDRLREEVVAAKLESAEERRMRIVAETERDLYKRQRDMYGGLLGKLVQVVTVSCGKKIDTSEYDQALAEYA